MEFLRFDNYTNHTDNDNIITLLQLTFAVFTNLFLGLRAFHHHQWYKKIFGKTYPMNRKAIVPYVF